MVDWLVMVMMIGYKTSWYAWLIVAFVTVDLTVLERMINKKVEFQVSLTFLEYLGKLFFYACTCNHNLRVCM